MDQKVPIQIELISKLCFYLYIKLFYQLQNDGEL